MLYTVTHAAREVGVSIYKVRYALRMRYISTDVLRGKRKYFIDLDKLREYFVLQKT